MAALPSAHSSLLQLEPTRYFHTSIHSPILALHTSPTLLQSILSVCRSPSTWKMETSSKEAVLPKRRRKLVQECSTIAIKLGLEILVLHLLLWSKSSLYILHINDSTMIIAIILLQTRIYLAKSPTPRVTNSHCVWVKLTTSQA